MKTVGVVLLLIAVGLIMYFVDECASNLEISNTQYEYISDVSKSDDMVDAFPLIHKALHDGKITKKELDEIRDEISVIRKRNKEFQDNRTKRSLVELFKKEYCLKCNKINCKTCFEKENR